MVVCLASGGVAAAEVGYWLVTMHCVTTTSEFYTVEVIYRRYGTRSWAGVGGLAYATPSVFSASVPASMVTIGLPPSSIFAAKFAFLAGVVSVSPLFSLA
jgi:NADH:ubiquinone oxidoreductase subunit 4 (subunit M)